MREGDERQDRLFDLSLMLVVAYFLEDEVSGEQDRVESPKSTRRIFAMCSRIARLAVFGGSHEEEAQPSAEWKTETFNFE